MTPSVVRAWIGLGANLGDATAALRAALDAIDRLPQTSLHTVSSFYASAPIDSSGPDYLNAVAAVDTSLAPEALLAALLAIEADHGRERPYRNAPRTLDLDLLLYAEEQSTSATLTLPHPRLHQRAFVLAPLAELAPALIVPGIGESTAQLLESVADQHIRRLG